MVTTRGFVVDFRPATPSLALLAASAVLLSTSPLRAQSVDDAGVAAGSVIHTAVASATAIVGPGKATASNAVVRVAASSAAPSTAPPSPPPEDNRAALRDNGAALRTVGYVAGGVGIVGFVLFAVAGIGAKNAHDKLEEECSAGPCADASHQSRIEDGKLLQTAANIGLAAALTGLGLGATLIVLGNHAASDTTPAVGMSVTGGMITYGARF